MKRNWLTYEMEFQWCEEHQVYEKPIGRQLAMVDRGMVGSNVSYGTFQLAVHEVLRRARRSNT